MSRHIIEDMNSVPEICKRHNHQMYWYGDWYCSKCQEEDLWAEQEALGRWYSESGLCQKCSNANEGGWDDKCEAYDMPLHMVKRKNKCKRFKEINWSIIS